MGMEPVSLPLLLLAIGSVLVEDDEGSVLIAHIREVGEANGFDSNLGFKLNDTLLEGKVVRGRVESVGPGGLHFGGTVGTVCKRELVELDGALRDVMEYFNAPT